MLTPEGEILHALGGFVPRDDLLRELRFALETFRAIETSERPAKEVVRERQEELLRQDAERAKQPDPDDPFAGLRDDEGQAIHRRLKLGRIEQDRRFVAKHPLLHVDDYRTSMLGRGGADFFGSRSGTAPVERLGEDDTIDDIDIDELMRRLRAQGDAGDAPPTE